MRICLKQSCLGEGSRGSSRDARGGREAQRDEEVAGVPRGATRALLQGARVGHCRPRHGDGPEGSAAVVHARGGVRGGAQDTT